MQKQYHIFFSGQVQGVGFRYTARAYALKHGVYGWVRNCSNGKVELCIQGEIEMLQSFLDDINQEFKAYIRDIETSERAADETCTDFRIRF